MGLALVFLAGPTYCLPQLPSVLLLFFFLGHSYLCPSHPQGSYFVSSGKARARYGLLKTL